MFKRLNKTYKTKDYNLILVLYINLLLISFIICDDTSTPPQCQGCAPISSGNFKNINSLIGSGTCNINCRFSVRYNQWYLCSASTEKYYYFDEHESCHTASTCQIRQNQNSELTQNRVVYPSNECLPSCGSIHSDLISNFYELGDYCIFDTGNSYVDNNKYLVVNEGYNKVSCQKCTSIEPIDDNKFYTCVDCQNCPIYYDDDDKKCVDNCEGKKMRNDGNKYSCKKECPRNEYENEEKNIEDDKTITYCLPDCPKNKYYYQQAMKATQCIDSCNPNDFYIEGSNQCVSNCDGLIYKENNKNFYTCRKPETAIATAPDCPNSHPYRYFDYCFKSCADSQNFSLLLNKKHIQ